MSSIVRETDSNLESLGRPLMYHDDYYPQVFSSDNETCLHVRSPSYEPSAACSGGAKCFSPTLAPLSWRGPKQCWQ